MLIPTQLNKRNDMKIISSYRATKDELYYKYQNCWLNKMAIIAKKLCQ